MRVLVTRPQPAAARTAQRLAELGHEPVLLPLTRTVALAPAPVPETAFRSVAATSAAAFDHADPALLHSLRTLPCAVVGEASAAAARRAGFRDVLVGGGDAARLAAAVIARRFVAPLAFLCGRVRRPDFEAMLNDAGLEAMPIEVYDTLPIERDAASVERTLGAPVQAVLVASYTAAERLAKLYDEPAVRPLLAQAALLAISARVAAPLTACWPGEIRVAREPSESGLLSLL